MADDNGDYFLAPQDQRVFGAGIKRTGIAFVPASDPGTPIGQTRPQKNGIGDVYLSIVTGKRGASEQPGVAKPVVDTCAVCKLPLVTGDKIADTSHESSIAHQVCLEHSHPPSHLDRDHVGVKYLSSYGWNPDSRLGLGARQEGIRNPIKAKAKHDTAGLRENVDEDDILTKKKPKITKNEKPTARLDAKQVRIKDQEARKRAERLRQSFYGRDLSQYLGPGG